MTPNISDRSIYPDMTRWFNPFLLSKLLFRVIVSDVFGQYADRRLMMAALDTVDPVEHFNRARAGRLPKDADGAAWIDFIADMGDGFDATYAMALLVGKDILAFGKLSLPRASTLILGGDQVYPTSTVDAYRFQLGAPYSFARPDHNRQSDDGTPVYAIPGNHDWYDGLVSFLAFFSREKSWHMGAWRTRQRRSYFALELTEKWWLWAIDIQLAEDMDQPQADYFKIIAERMPRETKIILCGAEPGWLYAEKNAKSFEIVDYAVSIAIRANRGHTVPILLSGDTHHYSRYTTEEGVQFITSGGGGAFLHPTHQLEDNIVIRWLGKPTVLSLKCDPATHQPGPSVACYPTRETSSKLLRGNIWFPIKNWDFSILMGAIYWLLAIALTLRPTWDAYIITVAIFAGTLTKYTQYQEKSKRLAIYASGILQGLAHACAIILLAKAAASLNVGHFSSGQWYEVWLWLAALLAEVGVLGGLAGAFFFGMNLLITCRYFKMNDNDAFSALRLNSYRHFLRIRIKEGEIMIYAIGLDAIPQRDEWQLNQNASAGNSDEPVFLPKVPLAPHLIEEASTLVASRVEYKLNYSPRPIGLTSSSRGTPPPKTAPKTTGRFAQPGCWTKNTSTYSTSRVGGTSIRACAIPQLRWPSGSTRMSS